MNYLYEALEKPTRLYIKQCPHCGIKYFGKSIGHNIEKYQGSGTFWKKHLREHNVKPIHLWNSDWYYDASISRFALKFSHINKIVESKQWANNIPENGLDGIRSKASKLIQSVRIANGTHHLLNSVTCVDLEGNMLRISQEEYYANNSLVNHLSKEGFRRLGKSESERIIPDVTGMDFSETKNCLVGDERTDKQKKSAKEHSERMKGRIPANKGKPGHSSNKDKKWYNNGIQETLFHKHDKIPDGFVLGTLVKRPSGNPGSKWINNGLDEKKIDYIDDLPNGYMYGRITIECPHCKKTGAGGSMFRWHFENCKDKNKE
jgi:hypothetical protein